MFLEQKLAGVLVIAKAGFDNGYTPEEIELVKAVAAATVLFLECLCCSYKQAETQPRELVRQEMDRLLNDFLNLASHELKTSLTVIKGNIQVSQRRLAALKRQLAEQPERVSEQIERVQDPLPPAPHNARFQDQITTTLTDTP